MSHSNVTVQQMLVCTIHHDKFTYQANIHPRGDLGFHFKIGVVIISMMITTPEYIPY